MSLNKTSDIRPSYIAKINNSKLTNTNNQNILTLSELITSSSEIINLSESIDGSVLKKIYKLPSISPKDKTVPKVSITIIIAYHYSNLISDLKTYWSENFIGTTIPTVNVYSFGTESNSDWALEECLDLQVVCSMNPNAIINVVEAVDNNISNLLEAIAFSTNQKTISNYTIKYNQYVGGNTTPLITKNITINKNSLTNTIKSNIVTMSWGVTTNEITTKIFSNAINTCFCASTGDSNTTSWPSVLKECVSVGGTTLNSYASDYSSRVETIWNKAGCGYSYINTPTYQKYVTKNNTAIVNKNLRICPDVSMTSNAAIGGISIYYNGNWLSVGGTSLSCPFFASILSLANQQIFNNNYTKATNKLKVIYKPLSSVLGSSSINIQTALYNLLYPSSTVISSPYRYNKSLYTYNKCFNTNITGSDLGSSDQGTSLTNFANTQGLFNIATGLGSPNAKILIEYLSSLS